MEATLLPRMAGRTLLMDYEKDGIAIAIEGDGSYPLTIAGALALDPDLAATSTEIGRPTS